jgi:2-phospho-L-lactate guanylyltransferase (CobY/MobA/RfbA family)
VETGDLPRLIEDAVERATAMDWRLQDLVIQPARPGGRRVEPPEKGGD